MRRATVRHPLTVESWRHEPRGWVVTAGKIVYGVGAILLGMGIAWILQALHGAGVTP